MAKEDIDPTINDVAFVVMVLLFAGYCYLFVNTIFSMRRAETRQVSWDIIYMVRLNVVGRGGSDAITASVGIIASFSNTSC